MMIVLGFRQMLQESNPVNSGLAEQKVNQLTHYRRNSHRRSRLKKNTRQLVQLVT